MVFCVLSVKPTLKKVSKYENKFAKLQKKAAEFNFRNQLKVVKKKEFTLEEEDKEVKYRERLHQKKRKTSIFTQPNQQTWHSNRSIADRVGKTGRQFSVINML